MISSICLWILCDVCIVRGHLDWALMLAVLATALALSETAP